MNQQLTQVEMQAMIDKLQAENAALTKASQRKITLKVSKRGAVSLYGFGRFPTTLYIKQWNAVLDMADDIRAFIEANKALLSTGKDDPRFASVGDDE